MKLQAEKKLEMQLTTVKQQHSKTQEALKEKENQLEKLQAQLKTTQGSFEEEMKNLKGQITTLEESNAKKASDLLSTNTDGPTGIILILLYHKALSEKGDFFSPSICCISLRCCICVFLNVCL